MSRLKYLSFLVLGLSATMPCRAEFDGLPGYRFGQSKESIRSETEMTLNGRKVVVKDSSFKPFKEWEIGLSAKTLKVFGMSSLVKFETIEECDRERERIINFFLKEFASERPVEIEKNRMVIMRKDGVGHFDRGVELFQCDKSLSIQIADLDWIKIASGEQESVRKEREDAAKAQGGVSFLGIKFREKLPDGAIPEKGKDGWYEYKLDKPMFGVTRCSINVTPESKLVAAILATVKCKPDEYQNGKASKIVREMENCFHQKPEGDATTWIFYLDPDQGMDFTKMVKVESGADMGGEVLVSAIDLVMVAVARRENMNSVEEVKNVMEHVK